MQGRKAPGIDGVEFYKEYWNILEADLLEILVLNHDAPPKRRKPPGHQELAPVSLLCVDYKVSSKMMAFRLRGGMEHIIHQDQTYCVTSLV